MRRRVRYKTEVVQRLAVAGGSFAGMRDTMIGNVRGGSENGTPLDKRRQVSRVEVVVCVQNLSKEEGQGVAQTREQSFHRSLRQGYDGPFAFTPSETWKGCFVLLVYRQKLGRVREGVNHACASTRYGANANLVSG